MRSATERRIILLALMMTLATLVIYWRVTGYDFVGLDDDINYYQNPWVQSGLRWSTLWWSFTNTVVADWHPLTWISLLADFSLWGNFAGGAHLTNIVLHALDSFLLFWVLARLTKSPWPSLLVAALFAWHPLHVESVAWVTERKDVLSGLWWILAVWAYFKSQIANHKFYFVAALLLFAFGLMSKPMVVTLPFVLLLLDYWPLNRVISWRLVAEKTPFFLVAAGDCVLTFWAQHSGGAVKTLEEVPLYLRLINVPAACAAYLGKVFWPSGLCAYYPLVAKPRLWPAIIAAVILTGLTVLFVRLRRACPWLIVGWLWFLGTLVPVIGIVQIGRHALADRFMYIPSIGLFIMVAWTLQYCLTVWPRAKMAVGATAAAGLVCCAVATERQITFWRNSFALFSRVLMITPDCAMAHNNLGIWLSSVGRHDEAINHFKEALRLEPNQVRTLYNLGIELAGAGRLDGAMTAFNAALKLNSHNEELHNNAGVVLAQQGKLREALDHFEAAIRVNPEYQKPYLNSAKAWETLGNYGAAVTNYDKALQLAPRSPETLDKFALMLATCKDSHWRNSARAVELARRACDLTYSQSPDYLSTLAAAYAGVGQYSNAVTMAGVAWRQATARGMKSLADKLNHDLQTYKAGK